MGHRICDARPQDIEGIERLERECFSCPWTKDQLSSYLRGPGHELLVALDEEERLLGYLGMMYVLDEGYISNVAVSSSFRRQGLGRELIRAMLERAADLELSFVTLEARASNDAAVGLYSGEGFREVGRRRNYYRSPTEDAVLMTYYLK